MARPSKSARKYGSAADRAKKAAAQAGPGGGGGTMFNVPQGIQFYKPEEGKATIRILPYIVTDPKHPDGELAPVGDIWYKRPAKRVRNIGAEKKSYISPKSVGKPCPILEYYTAAKADPSIPDKEANRAKPQDIVLYNVQVLDPKTKEFSEPMFFFYSYHNFEKALKKELMDPDNEEYLAFMDLEGGFDIRVRWEKESFEKNDFLVAGNISFIERDDIDEDILEQVVNLDECLVIKSYKELQNIFLEIDDEEPEERTGDDPERDQDEPPTPPRRRKSAEPEPEPEKPAGRKRAAKEPDPEPEPEKAPSRRRRSEPEPEPEKKEDECPHGFTFGEDWDTKRKCEKCDVFDACGKAYDATQTKADDKPAGKKGKVAAGKGDSNECPSGYTFGTDCDSKKECNDCPKWDECMDRQEELEKK